MPLKLCFRARAALFAPAALALVLFASGRVVSASGQASASATCRPGAADSRLDVDGRRGDDAAQCRRSGADGPREQSRDPGRTAVAADQHAERLAGAGGVCAGAVLELPRPQQHAAAEQLHHRQQLHPHQRDHQPERGAAAERAMGRRTLHASRSTASKITTSAIDSRYNPQLSSNLSAQYVQPLLRGFKTDSLRQQIETSQNNQVIADIGLREQVTVTTQARPQRLLRSDWRRRRLQGLVAVAAARTGVAEEQQDQGGSRHAGPHRHHRGGSRGREQRRSGDQRRGAHQDRGGSAARIWS